MRTVKKDFEHIVKTPWDSKVFGMPTYEIRTLSKKVMEQAIKLCGHFTVKVDPSSSKKLLHDPDFYYCDTLIEPCCTPDRFTPFKHEKASISRDASLDDLIAVSHGAFYGRFHRDFNIDKKLADLRYDAWLKELYNEGEVFGLLFDNELAGFWGLSENRIRLHAVDKKYRNRKLAKYLWTPACEELFKKGHKEISSSVSTLNPAVLNLYSSLGFKFRNPLDVYHRLVT